MASLPFKYKLIFVSERNPGLYVTPWTLFRSFQIAEKSLPDVVDSSGSSSTHSIVSISSSSKDSLTASATINSCYSLYQLDKYKFPCGSLRAGGDDSKLSEK